LQRKDLICVTENKTGTMWRGTATARLLLRACVSSRVLQQHAQHLPPLQSAFQPAILLPVTRWIQTNYAYNNFTTIFYSLYDLYCRFLFSRSQGNIILNAIVEKCNSLSVPFHFCICTLETNTMLKPLYFCSIFHLFIHCTGCTCNCGITV